jgi:transketolase
VIDLYSVKPLDAATLREAAVTTGNLVTVEDHWPAGGLGEAVLSAVADLGPRVITLAVRGMPGSAKPDEQLQDAGIDRWAICRAVQQLR